MIFYLGEMYAKFLWLTVEILLSIFDFEVIVYHFGNLGTLFLVGFVIIAYSIY